jgi:hypothetical protein
MVAFFLRNSQGVQNERWRERRGGPREPFRRFDVASGLQVF